MVAHMLFTKLMDALFCSYTNLGTKMPKNDATITRKKTTQLLMQPDTNFHPVGHASFVYFINLTNFWFFDKKFIL